MHTLLSTYASIPIVNENDTVSTSELRFGDNDTLSAITAGLVDADYLFLCTDVDGLYTENPRSDPNARRLGVVGSVQEARRAVSVDKPGSNFGTGGMQTKLIAAELATAAGVATVIVSSERPADVVDIIQRGVPTPSSDANQPISLQSSISNLAEDQAVLVGYPALTSPNHTLFLPTSSPLPSRKWSILHALHPSGTIIIDEGAYGRISKPESGGRLLPAGVVGVKGNWERMQAVRLVVRKAVPHADNDDGETRAPPAPRYHSVEPRNSLSSIIDESKFTRSSSPLTTPVINSLTHVSHKAVAAAATAVETSAPASASLERSNEQQKQGSWEYHEIGRCLANYTSLEVERIKGLKSREISRVLGHADSDYVTDQVALVERIDELEAVGTQ